jgi:hypothetical protein
MQQTQQPTLRKQQRPDTPFVYVIVLNWNGFEDTHECLHSLRNLAYPRYQVLVVDNGSQDDSPQRLAAAHPEIELLTCAQNRGIAAGYNRGIAAALERGADAIVVMNNDLSCSPLFLPEMVAVQQKWPDCGLVMPKIFYYDEPDIIWSAGAYARWIPSNIVMRGKRRDGPQFRHVEPLAFAPSCCLLLTRQLCEQIEFDEAYFFYYDDWDFCVQTRNVGRQLLFAPRSHIWHKVSRSTQNSPKSRRWWRILGQSCVRYHRKHHSLRLLAFYVAWVCLRETIKGNWHSLPVFLSGIATGLRARALDDMQPGWNV